MDLHLEKAGGTSQLFESLNDAERLLLGSALSWNDYSRGEMILQQGERSSDVYIVERGIVAAKGFSAKGQEVFYTEIKAGETFGEFSAIDGKPRSASIEALQACRVGRLDAATFRKLLQQNAALALRIAENLVRKNRDLTQRIFELSTMLVRQRVCAELARLALGDGSVFVIDPAPSHYELAARLATHREAVSKELSNLAHAGIIKTGRRRIVVLDIAALRASGHLFGDD